ncbi:MAG: nucleotidyltransferase family protein [Chloroflexi bacterium]|nr:nucleotidyltransferase family protein [Chloroflexota bacterium]
MNERIDITYLLDNLRALLPQLTEQYMVESLGIFGSYIRHEQDLESDLDLLVTFHEVPGLLKFIELENYLTDVLGVKVDLIMRSALKPRIAKRILDEVVLV